MNSPRAQPLYFGPESRPLFGWLHRAATENNLGLVICNPFGHEAQSCHRSLRHWAQSAAATGIPALRFDFDGTGDSCGSDTDQDRLAAWIGSVQSAVATLKQTTGVHRVALLGVRLGALLATLAASENPEVCALALVAPVISGKAWLREMRALHSALALSETPADAEPLPDGAREALGFFLSAQTQQSLTEIDLSKIEKAPAARVLWLDRDDLPNGEKVRAHFEALGAEVDHQTLPGYADMMRDPHESQVPQTMIAATTDWLCSMAAKNASSPISAPIKTSALVSDKVQEHAVFLDDERQLFGIVSAPREKNIGQAHKAILLINSGANHRTGPNNLYVKLARHFARRGHLVLRMDIAGLGDSLPHKNEDEHIVYTPHATNDVQTALKYLRDKWNVTECHAAGLCSGGYHAFKAALAGAPLNGVILINPLTFNWKVGDSLYGPNSQVIAEAERYKQSMMQADKWKNLLRGKTSAKVVAQFVGRRVADVAGRRALNAAQRFGYRRRDDLGAALETLARRGVALQFLFSEDDPGFALLHEQGGAAVSRLEKAGFLTIQRLAGPDHTFTPLWSHPHLIAAVEKTFE